MIKSPTDDVSIKCRCHHSHKVQIFKVWSFYHFEIAQQNTLSGKSTYRTSNKKRKNKTIAVDKQNVHVKLF